ncbi:hypothetical protein R0J90_16570, partial [Micrococcus sp. SIMBA_144]
KEFISWLKKKGYLEELTFKASDIEWMYVSEQNSYDVVSGQNVEQAVAELKKEGKAIEVKETGQIEAIMNQLEYDPNDYTLILKFQNEGRI